MTTYNITIETDTPRDDELVGTLIEWGKTVNGNGMRFGYMVHCDSYYVFESLLAVAHSQGYTRSFATKAWLFLLADMSCYEFGGTPRHQARLEVRSALEDHRPRAEVMLTLPGRTKPTHVLRDVNRWEVSEVSVRNALPVIERQNPTGWGGKMQELLYDWAGKSRS